MLKEECPIMVKTFLTVTINPKKIGKQISNKVRYKKSGPQAASIIVVI